IPPMERRKGGVESTLEAFRLPFTLSRWSALRSFSERRPSSLRREGAGAASRQTVDTVLFGGMIAAMVLTVLFDSGLFRHIPDTR
ncbi:MAG: hypothetical protein MK538_08425, partial [Planctomycetes bacterium]|nr:hypothetical protein [Planctomycetota bacterium]